MDSFRSTVLGRSHDDDSNGNGSNGSARRRAIDILNPEPEPPASSSASASASSYLSRQPYASTSSSSSHRAHDSFALRSPSKAAFRPLASPSSISVRQASPATVGPAVNNLLNNSPPPQHRAPPAASAALAAPAAPTPYLSRDGGDAPAGSRDKASGSYYDPTTDTTTGSSGAASYSGDRHASDARHRHDNSHGATASSQVSFRVFFGVICCCSSSTVLYSLSLSLSLSLAGFSHLQLARVILSCSFSVLLPLPLICFASGVPEIRDKGLKSRGKGRVLTSLGPAKKKSP